MKYPSLLLFFLFALSSYSQSYFPPTNGDDWETMNPSDLGWCPDKVDSLIDLLEVRNTKAFMILKDGKIVLENYFGTYTQDSLWYWASAAKTITATLVGKAQEDNLLSITDPVSQYLGEGWTSCSAENEETRTIFHQLSMSSSFDNNPFLWDCVSPDCFQCTDLDAGTQWHYHNGVYRRLIEVVEEATGISRNNYTDQVIESITGMNGFWFGNFYFSKHRDMARFGLLALNNFIWDETPVLSDTDYINALTNPSQSMNPSYGYLWWLNGQESYMLPLINENFAGPLVPSGPEDMFMALGANDQKIYVVPSLNMVVTRQGDEAIESVFASSNFDEELWAMISDLECEDLSSNISIKENVFPALYPNPSQLGIRMPEEAGYQYDIYSIDGILNERNLSPKEFLKLPSGVYVVSYKKNGVSMHRRRHVVH